MVCCSLQFANVLCNTTAQRVEYSQADTFTGISDSLSGNSDPESIGGIGFYMPAYQGWIPRMFCYQSLHCSLLPSRSISETYAASVIDKEVTGELMPPTFCRGSHTEVVFLAVSE